MRRVLALAIATTLALPACAWSRTQRLGAIDPWPPRIRIESPPSVALRIYGISRFEGTPGDLEQAELGVWRDEALRAYRESGLFSRVETTWQPSQVIAEVSISKSTGEQKLLPVFILATLLYRQTGIVMRTRFRRGDGSLIRMIELSEDIRTERFLVAPLKESEESLRAILYDLYRATLSQAAGRSVFAPAALEIR
jgi:hypothetical protein